MVRPRITFNREIVVNPPGQDLAPRFKIEVENFDVSEELHRAIEDITFEQADTYPDKCTISVADPTGEIIDGKVFQVGNQINVYMGYGSALRFIGRVLIWETQPQFSADDIPRLELTCYSYDIWMSKNEPDSSKGRSWSSNRYADAVESIANRYNMALDIDETQNIQTGLRNGLFQRAGVNDLQFLHGLANNLNFLFWVDATENGKWTLHFKDPNAAAIQDKKFIFKMQRGDAGSLSSFTPLKTLSNTRSSLTAQVKKSGSSKLLTVTIDGLDNLTAQPGTQFSGDEMQKQERNDSAPSVTIQLGNRSIQHIPNRQFENEKQLEAFARGWFARNNELYFTADGEAEGVSEVKARDVHGFEGMSRLYDGDYYFYTVSHTMSASSGYKISFNLAKVPDQEDNARR